MKRLGAEVRELGTLACRAADWGERKKREELVRKRSQDGQSDDGGKQADAGLPTTLTQTHAHYWGQRQVQRRRQSSQSSQCRANIISPPSPKWAPGGMGCVGINRAKYLGQCDVGDGCRKKARPGAGGSFHARAVIGRYDHYLFSTKSGKYWRLYYGQSGRDSRSHSRIGSTQ